MNIEGTLSHDGVTGVAEDEEGNLWVGTSGGGLNRFIRENRSFEIFRKGMDASVSPLSDRIRTVNAGLDGRIWLGYQDGGFSAFHPATKLFKHYTQERWPQISGDAVTSILEEADGGVWLATDGNGLLKLDLSTETVSRAGGEAGEPIRLASNYVQTIYRDSSGALWIGTRDKGVSRSTPDGRTRVYTRIVSPSKSEYVELTGVHQVREDSVGAIFFATHSGIALFDKDSNALTEIPIRNQADATPRLFSFIQDRSGRYWAGGVTGIYSGFKSPFVNINSDSGLYDENILSVATAGDGNVWVGTAAGLQRAYLSTSSGLASSRQSGLLIESPVTTLLAEDKTLWVGTFDSGLTAIDLSGDDARHYLPDPKLRSSLSSNQITTLLRDSFGNLWVGTFANGLSVMKAGESDFVHHMHDPDDPYTISDDTVYALYQERNGDLWVGTKNGLNRFNYDVGSFDRFMHDRDRPGSLSSRVVYSIHEDAKARLWVGTQGGGLDMWEPVDRKSSIGQFQYFQSNIGLPSSTIYAMQGDNQDNIWLSTSGGLTRFNFERMEAKNFTADDGLQSNDFNLGASARDKSGRLYFGGSKGLNVFYPDVIEDNPIPPAITMTRISLGNEQVWFDEPYDEVASIELQPDEYMLGFSFAALDFNAPMKNLYRYQMVGLDKNWINLGNRNTVDFTNLPIGQYVFRVQGANPDGIWNPRGIAIDVTVHPPFYLTWWAFFFYIVSSLSTVVYIVYRQRQKEEMQLQYQNQLESDVRGRTRDLRRSNDKLQSAVDEIGRARLEAVDANQAKSEFLAALSHEIRTPMHGVLGMTDLLLHSGLSERQHGFAESAHVSANELLGLIDNILDFSKIEAGKLELEETTFNLREATENLCYLYGELAQAKNVELNLIFNADLRRQVYGDPVRLRQVLQNLLSNAIKFTKRGSVNVTVNELARRGKSIQLEFLVEDTGIGMTQETIHRVFEAFSQADSSTTRQYGGTGLGLSIAKQLIELMHGELQVRSKAGVGTTMAVELALVESPIYTDKLSTAALEDFYAEVVAPMPETRAMLRSQLESLSMQVRECSVVEELAPQAEHKRLVLVDVNCLYNSACIAQMENLSQDPATLVLLVAPLSLEGIPPELEHLPHTTKPSRSAGLVNDILAAESDEAPSSDGEHVPLLRFDKRILLVEDMTANQEIARAMLESFGCSVAIARNGSVALEMYQHDEFDFVLMDCQMPVMDGFEATRHIRQLETQLPGSARIPVVALTAGKTEVEKERCYASGMDRILFKPYSTADLNSILGQYFDACGEVEIPKVQSATPKSAGVDLLDIAALDNIRSVEVHSGNALLPMVFENFKTDVQLKLDELRANADDAAVLGSGAHAIKSMSLNMGAKALSEYCRICEASWKKENIANAPREIEVLHGHFVDAVRALEQLIEPDTEAAES
ncbi:MAG: two-component regulator propeller domain-containing protein [Halieaceae bacterium]